MAAVSCSFQRPLYCLGRRRVRALDQVPIEEPLKERGHAEAFRNAFSRQAGEQCRASRRRLEAFRTHDTCLTMRSILGISIISISIVVLLAGFAPRKFCVGFKQGYTAGYRRGLGIDQPVTFPACPASAQKSPGGREAGYLIGFMQGMADGERDWAILGRRVFFHHTSPKLG